MYRLGWPSLTDGKKGGSAAAAEKSQRDGKLANDSLLQRIQELEGQLCKYRRVIGLHAPIAEPEMRLHRSFLKDCEYTKPSHPCTRLRAPVGQ